MSPPSTPLLAPLPTAPQSPIDSPRESEGRREGEEAPAHTESPLQAYVAAPSNPHCSHNPCSSRPLCSTEHGSPAQQLVSHRSDEPRSSWELPIAGSNTQPDLQEPSLQLGLDAATQPTQSAGALSPPCSGTQPLPEPSLQLGVDAAIQPTQSGVAHSDPGSGTQPVAELSLHFNVDAATQPTQSGGAQSDPCSDTQPLPEPSLQLGVDAAMQPTQSGGAESGPCSDTQPVAEPSLHQLLLHLSMQPTGGPTPQLLPHGQPEPTPQLPPHGHPEPTPQLPPHGQHEATPRLPPHGQPEATPHGQLEATPQIPPHGQPEATPRLPPHGPPQCTPQLPPHGPPQSTPQLQPHVRLEATEDLTLPPPQNPSTQPVDGPTLWLGPHGNPEATEGPTLSLPHNPCALPVSEPTPQLQPHHCLQHIPTLPLPHYRSTQSVDGPTPQLQPHHSLQRTPTPPLAHNLGTQPEGAPTPQPHHSLQLSHTQLIREPSLSLPPSPGMALAEQPFQQLHSQLGAQPLEAPTPFLHPRQDLDLVEQATPKAQPYARTRHPGTGPHTSGQPFPGLAEEGVWQEQPQASIQHLNPDPQTYVEGLTHPLLLQSRTHRITQPVVRDVAQGMELDQGGMEVDCKHVPEVDQERVPEVDQGHIAAQGMEVEREHVPICHGHVSMQQCKALAGHSERVQQRGLEAWELHLKGSEGLAGRGRHVQQQQQQQQATPQQERQRRGHEVWELHQEGQPQVLGILPLRSGPHQHQAQQGVQQHQRQRQQQQYQQQQQCQQQHQQYLQHLQHLHRAGPHQSLTLPNMGSHTLPHTLQGTTAAAAAVRAAEGMTTPNPAAQRGALQGQAPGGGPCWPTACQSYAFGRRRRRQAAQAAAWRDVAASAAAATTTPAGATAAAATAAAAEGKACEVGSDTKKRGRGANRDVAGGSGGGGGGGAAAAAAAAAASPLAGPAAGTPFVPGWLFKPAGPPRRAQHDPGSGSARRGAGCKGVFVGRAGGQRQGSRWEKNCKRELQKGSGHSTDGELQQQQQQERQWQQQPQQLRRQQQQQQQQQQEHKESMEWARHGALNQDQHPQGCEQQTDHALLQQHQNQNQQGSGLGLLRPPPNASSQPPDSQPVSARTRRRQRRSAALASAFRNAPPDPPHTLLLRLVDDYLMLSSSRAAAEALLTRLERGFPEYGCSINAAKTQVNFSSEESSGLGARPSCADAPPEPALTGRPTSSSQDSPIRWCGLLINPTSLEVQADYSRYAGTHIATVLTVPLTNHPGRQLPVRLMLYMRPKCHPLLLDATINSPLTARLNIFQAFMMSAMKLHSYVRTLVHVSAGPGVRGLSPARHPRHLLNAIFSACAYMAGIVRRCSGNTWCACQLHAALHLRCRCFWTP
ncbi:hypothetical protein DUNSADRAFT_82 [Dunaliella salina]|uniref:Telomerase reverse transcriptase n=1 Tax=Dunaliella salina TaxID=3046 RepID=A0ABQ7H8U8_DUNSA|nr:hypothetical protein DUNSADRAFT_82 [Dunaliella salina]|eukprot:KAF5843279.1 hypothetical protein DUNSADRAFT_82 [Dunaliella salina]